MSVCPDALPQASPSSLRQTELTLGNDSVSLTDRTQRDGLPPLGSGGVALPSDSRPHALTEQLQECSPAEAPFDDVVPMRSDAAAPQRDDESGAARGTRILGIRCALDITEKPPTPEEIYFPGLAVAGETSGLASFGGSGASTFFLNLGVALAGGTGFLNEPPKPPKPVLVIEFEDPQWRIAQKLRAIADAHGLDVNSTLARIAVANMDDSGPISPELLGEAIRQHRPALVLIAPFARLESDAPEFNEENSNVQIHRLVLAYSKVARQTKTALVINAHTSKHKCVTSFKIDDVRGGSALTRAARMFAAFGPLNAARSLWRSSFVKDNTGLRRTPCSFDLVSADGRAAFRLATEAERAADSAEPSLSRKHTAVDRVRECIARFIGLVPAGESFSRCDALAFVQSECSDMAAATAGKRLSELLPAFADPADGQKRVWRPRKQSAMH